MAVAMAEEKPGKPLHDCRLSAFSRDVQRELGNLSARASCGERGGKKPRSIATRSPQERLLFVMLAAAALFTSSVQVGAAFRSSN